MINFGIGGDVCSSISSGSECTTKAGIGGKGSVAEMAFLTPGEIAARKSSQALMSGSTGRRGASGKVGKGVEPFADISLIPDTLADSEASAIGTGSLGKSGITACCSSTGGLVTALDLLCHQERASPAASIKAGRFMREATITPAAEASAMVA